MARLLKKSRRPSSRAPPPDAGPSNRTEAPPNNDDRNTKRRRISRGSDISMELLDEPPSSGPIARGSKRGAEEDDRMAKRARRTSRESVSHQAQADAEDSSNDEEEAASRKRPARGPRLSSESVNRLIARSHKRSKTASSTHRPQGKRAIDAVDSSSGEDSSEELDPGRTRNADSDVEDEAELQQAPPSHSRQSSARAEPKRGRIHKRRQGSDDDELMSGTISEALEPVADVGHVTGPPAAKRRGVSLVSSPSAVTRLLKQRRKALFAVTGSN